MILKTVFHPSPILTEINFGKIIKRTNEDLWIFLGAVFVGAAVVVIVIVVLTFLYKFSLHIKSHSNYNFILKPLRDILDYGFLFAVKKLLP